MEQGSRLDSTAVSAEQGTTDLNRIGTGRDAAIAAMLTAPEEAGAVDPILALIEAARAAERYAGEDLPGDGAPAGSPEEVAAVEERIRRAVLSDDAHRAVFAVVPTTHEGLFALIDFARERVKFQEGMDDAPDVFGSIGAAVAALTGPGLPPRARVGDGEDPIFAAIAETRRLQAARDEAGKLPQPPGTVTTLPEQDAAFHAFHTHCDDVLLKTVPTTTAGCAALARYVIEYMEAENVALDEDESNNQNFRILDLIAKSPMLGSGGGAAQ